MEVESGNHGSHDRKWQLEAPSGGRVTCLACVTETLGSPDVLLVRYAYMRKCRVRKGTGSHSVVVCVSSYLGGQSWLYRGLLKLQCMCRGGTPVRKRHVFRLISPGTLSALGRWSLRMRALLHGMCVGRVMDSGLKAIRVGQTLLRG